MDDAWKSDDSDQESDGPTKIFTMDDDLDGVTDLDPRELHKRLRALKLQREDEAKKEQTAEPADGSTKPIRGFEDQADLSKSTKVASHARRKSKKSNEGQENQDPTRTRHPHPGYKKVIEDNRDHSPDSEVIESGVCSPRSEGIWRANRKDVAHWPATLEKEKKRDSKTG